MSTHHPITPPPELVQQWHQEAAGTHFKPFGYSEFIAAKAARWGADQELEACVNWLDREGWSGESRHLRAGRRPKPPSRKEQALEAISRLCASVIHDDLKNDAATIRRALEALDD